MIMRCSGEESKGLSRSIPTWKSSGRPGDGLELLQILEKTNPNMVILDISMPNLRGLEAAREIKKFLPIFAFCFSPCTRKKSLFSKASPGGRMGSCEIRRCRRLYLSRLIPSPCPHSFHGQFDHGKMVLLPIEVLPN